MTTNGSDIYAIEVYPISSNINSGDVYVLLRLHSMVCNQRVCLWVGKGSSCEAQETGAAIALQLMEYENVHPNVNISVVEEGDQFVCLIMIMIFQMITQMRQTQAQTQFTV